MKDPSRAHSPRPNRNINIILTTTYVESTAASASALLIIWSFSISISVRLQKITGNAKHVFIIANWKRALDKEFFSRYPHLSFISLIHNPLILRSVFFFLVHYIISPTSITLSITLGMFFFVFIYYKSVVL